MHLQFTIPAAVIGIERVGPVHLDGEFRHPLRRVRPWPSGGQHAMVVYIADTICQELVQALVQADR